MISGETLRLLRNIKGIKQETIAKRMGISQPAYCKLERASFIKEEKLCRVLVCMDCNKEDIEKVKQLVEL
jgi:transcriptional regulator with XRE-family HTH domain